VARQEAEGYVFARGTGDDRRPVKQGLRSNIKKVLTDPKRREAAEIESHPENRAIPT